MESVLLLLLIGRESSTMSRGEQRNGQTKILSIGGLKGTLSPEDFNALKCVKMIKVGRFFALLLPFPFLPGKLLF